MCVSYEQSGSAYKDDNQEENIRLTLPLYFLFQYVKAGSTAPHHYSPSPCCLMIERLQFLLSTLRWPRLGLPLLT